MLVSLYLESEASRFLKCLTSSLAWSGNLMQGLSCL